MSRESHQRHLERIALREAQKAIARHAGDTPLRLESLAQLRIQTVEPWKRIVLSVPALALLVAGVGFCVNGPLWLGLLLGIAGLALLAIAVIGRRKTIHSALDGIDIALLFEGLFDAF